MTNEEIFIYEEKRLKDVISKINEQISENKKKFSEQEHFIIGFKEGLRGTQFNRQALMSFYATEINELERAITNPYFGRFEFTNSKDKEKKIIYIGKKAIMDKNDTAISYDWRSDICSLYYDYNIGPAEYETNGIKETGTIDSKRQIIIKNGTLEKTYEQDTISDDEILLKYLSECSDARLKSIIATIQREQNKIIRSPLKNNYIISGVAGSGKTTVALHRIAYLLYNEARNLNESNFMIIGPNKYFLDYVKALLPELDINNISSYTLEELALSNLKVKLKVENKNTTLDNVLNGKESADVIKYKSSKEYLELIESFVKSYMISHMKEDIIYEGIILCPADRIRNICIDSNYSDTYADKLDTIIKLLTKEIKNNHDQIYDNVWNEYRQEFLALPKNDPRRKEIIDITENIKNEIKKGCPQAIKEYFKFAKVNPVFLYQAFIENIDKFANDECIAELKETTLAKLAKKQITEADIAALLLIHYLLNDIKDYQNYRHLVIDEAQDLSVAEYHMLKKIFPEATFDIYGDTNQAIYDYQSVSNFDTLNKEIFNNKAVMLDLNKSYRTTKEIADTSNIVLESMDMPSTECIARSGKAITISDSIDIETILREINDLLAKNYENIAIICKDTKETDKVYKMLTKLGLNVNKITAEADKYISGITVLPSYLSKGLEFDSVIIYNANDINYQDNLIDKKLLYVAITRAMHELYINYQEKLTKALNKNESKKLIKIK